MSEGIREGTVVSFNREKGWGFIETPKGDYFCHHTNILMDGYRFLEPGDKVRFSIGVRGDRVQAVEIVVIG